MNSAEGELAISRSIECEVSASEDCLLLAARSGSHTAFAELQKAHSHRVYKRILSITRNREDAEDALQDAFLNAYLALPSFEGKSQLSTWLMRIGINSALMILRKRRRRPEMPFEQPQDSEGDGVYLDVRDEGLDPEQFCDQQQRCHAIGRALRRLDPKLRAVMRIRLSQEHSMEEIAQDLGVSVPSVKARIYRARQRLLRSSAFEIGRRVDSTGKNGRELESRSSRDAWQDAAKCVREVGFPG
jgi:RNA polymerase sigma-70 factor (ECF subfamily)